MREDEIVFSTCRKYGLRAKRIRDNHYDDSRKIWKKRFYILINWDGAEFRYYRVSGIPQNKEEFIEEIANALKRYHSWVGIYPYGENEVEFLLM